MGRLSLQKHILTHHTHKLLVHSHRLKDYVVFSGRTDNNLCRSDDCRLTVLPTVCNNEAMTSLMSLLTWCDCSMLDMNYIFSQQPPSSEDTYTLIMDVTSTHDRFGISRLYPNGQLTRLTHVTEFHTVMTPQYP
jgi:hypothetical protein